jgi:hypothetical protein
LETELTETTLTLPQDSVNEEAKSVSALNHFA